MPEPSDFERLLRSRQKAVDADNAVVERRLAEMYREAFADASRQLAELYARLGDKMTLPEAQKYNRLPSLLKEIAKEYQKLTGKSILLAIDTSAQNYSEAFYGYHWAMNQALGIELSWGVMPIEAIRASVFSEYSGLTLIKTFRKNAQQELSAIQSAITRGISTGQGYAKTAESMKGAFNRGFADAQRVIRTEAGRNYTEGHLLAHDQALELGIDVVKVWDATLDGRTRDAHGALDGQEEDAKGNFRSSAGGYGPGPGMMNNAADDINERCRITDVIRGMSPELRRIRGEGVVPYQTFAQWAEPQGWTRARGWPKVRGL